MKKVICILILVFTFCLSTFAQSQELKRPVQFSFIYPVGSNGIQSGKYTNMFSVNILGGYSNANTIFEVGSIFNINKQYTKGFQLGGITNISGCGDHSVQFAGITNYSGNQHAGVQVGGIANIVKSGTVAVQFGGIFNYAATAHAQIAGILNIARSVKGVQVGLINVADSCQGVPIGLFNIVRHGGKFETEVAFSDAINTTLSFKFGTDHLYTILSGGITYANDPCEYAVGLGLGTELKWKKGWANQFEVVGYSLTDNEKFKVGMDMLTQVKFTVSKQLARHFKVFAGPVLNFSAVDNGRVNHVNHYTLWHKTTANTDYKGWIGVTAGVRL